jgi:hypothetical protein
MDAAEQGDQLRPSASGEVPCVGSESQYSVEGQRQQDGVGSSHGGRREKGRGGKSVVA